MIKTTTLILFLVLIVQITKAAGPPPPSTIETATLDDEVRFFYQLINGTSDNTYAGGMGGPEGDNGEPIGFIGMVNSFMGVDSLGGGLISCGYTSCSDIPDTGSCSLTDSEGTFLMNFETPIKVIPTGMTGADGATKYSKRVEVSLDGSEFLNIEFNCDSTVGWFRLGFPEATGTRHIELYYDTVSAAATKLELAMIYEQDVNNKEFFQAKFATGASNTYDLFITRAGKDTDNDNGFRIAMKGNAATKEVSVFMLFEDGTYTNALTTHPDSNDITSGDIMCLNYSDPSNVTFANVDNNGNGGECAGLVIGTPGALIINSAGDMSIDSTVTDISGAMTSF